jgi:hypothetical protein
MQLKARVGGNEMPPTGVRESVVFQGSTYQEQALMFFPLSLNSTSWGRIERKSNDK